MSDQSTETASDTSKDEKTEQLRITKAFQLSIIGLVLAGILVLVLLAFGLRTATDIATVVGLFTSVIGTLVGLFFGYQIGASDKGKAETRASAAEARAETVQKNLDSVQANLSSLLLATDPATAAKAKAHGFKLNR
jgi:mannose/fructose/N-acetylgalactosamine-specific phosphotransferase system component IID